MQKGSNTAEQLSFVNGGFDRAEVIEQARQYIIAASQMLAGLGGEHARIGWVLEDSLMYLEEVEQKFVNERLLFSLGSKVENAVKEDEKRSVK